MYILWYTAVQSGQLDPCPPLQRISLCFIVKTINEWENGTRVQLTRLTAVSLHLLLFFFFGQLCLAYVVSYLDYCHIEFYQYFSRS